MQKEKQEIQQIKIKNLIQLGIKEKQEIKQIKIKNLVKLGIKKIKKFNKKTFYLKLLNLKILNFIYFLIINDQNKSLKFKTFLFIHILYKEY